MRSSQIDIFLDNLEDMTSKPMFGGTAIYFNGLLVAALMDDEKKTYRKKRYTKAPWNGVLIPTFKEHQESLMSILPIKPHPILKKWLYLPKDHLQYEEVLELFISLLNKKDSRLGVFSRRAL